MNNVHKDNAKSDSVRLDKWLWAARFYKTRSIAKEMIDGGKCIITVSVVNRTKMLRLVQ